MVKTVAIVYRGHGLVEVVRVNPSEANWTRFKSNELVVLDWYK